MVHFALVSGAGLRAAEPAASIAQSVSAAKGKVIKKLEGAVFARLTARSVARLRAQGLVVIEFPSPYELCLADRVLDIRRSRRFQRKLGPARGARWTQFVVQLAAPPQTEWLQELEAQGLRVAGRLGTYGLLLEGSADDAIRMRDAGFVAFMAPFQPEWRISHSLAESTGRVRFVSVSVSPAHTAGEVATRLEGLGGQIETTWDEAHTPGHDQRVIIVELDAGALETVSAWPEVRWIEHMPERYEPEEERTTQVAAGNLDGTPAPNTLPVVGYQAALTNLGFDGTGTVVAINDTGVDTNAAGAQADLAGRLAFGPATAGRGDVNGHGTHVAAIAVGNGASGDTDPQGFVLGQGVAPGARYGVLINPSFTSLAAFSETASQNDADVMNCSWRVNFSGAAYSNNDAVIDRAIRDADGGTGGLQCLPVVFSAGNGGPNATTCTKETKNAILVGNTFNARPGEAHHVSDVSDDIRGVNQSSSRGPANDGRLQPTVVAPGTSVISARSTVDRDTGTPGVQRPRDPYVDTGGNVHDDHTPMTGTSMAAPHVSGMCALLTEWWRDRTGNTDPSPAMLKALIVNGAVDCSGGLDGGGGNVGSIPNNVQGWGRASLSNVVLSTPAVQRGPKLFVDQRHAFTANNQTFTLRVAATDPTIPLRATLAWTDAPSTPIAGGGLVNDLDLEVTELTTGSFYRGNQFANGFSTTGGARDNVNNVECVYLPNPAGEYDITVRATSLGADARPPYGTTPWQDFALVVDNAERAASAPIDVVTCLDRSGSMVDFGYVDDTRTAAKALADRLRVSDGIGIVSFGSSAQVDFDDAGSVQDVTGAADRRAAKNAVHGIVFGGSTHMGPGLTASAGLLAASTGDRGIVLMSDGHDNGSPDAMTAVAGLPAGVPVYTAAMGPLSDQALLEQIATLTGGQYYYAPTVDDLFEIHNYLSGTLTGSSLVTNVSALASSSRVGAWIDSSATSASFQVTWARGELRFAAEEAHEPDEICVRLRQPNGKLVQPDASWVRRSSDRGHVVFAVDDPAPGRWFMEVSTTRDDHTRYTAAAFVDSDLRLSLRPLSSRLRAAVPGVALAAVTWNEETVPSIRVKGNVTQPAFDVRALLREHSDLVRRVKPVTGRPIDVVRLAAIQAALLKRGDADPLRHVERYLGFAHAPSRRAATPALAAAPPDGLLARSGTLVGRFVPNTAGSVNVAVQAQGTVPGGGDPFVRVGLTSVLVT